MNKSILQIELRKILPFYITALVVIISYVLFWPKPLMAGDGIIATAGFLQGFIITWIVFRDAPAVECFLFSRGITRQRLFWNRWWLVAVLMILMLIIAAAVISAGLRCLIFVNGPWHPMVKWYELNILWPLGLASVAGVSVRLFLLLRDRFLKPDKMLSTIRRVWKYILLVAAVGSAVLLGRVIPHMEIAIDYLLIASFYVAGLLILSTATARSCFLNMEIHT